MKSIAFALALSASVRGHGLISAITGTNGVVTMGFGVTNTVPRNGTSEQPFQLDTPVMKNLVDDPCGATLQGGSIDIAQSFRVALQQGGGQLPSLSPNGSITMTIHQVNADGGGPFTAQFNADGTGRTWENAVVTQQVPGANGILRGGPVDSQFTAQLPANTVCTGGPNNNACIIRINNGGAGLEQSLANGAGPFGGCAAVVANGATGADTNTGANTNTGTNTNTGANTGTNTGTNNNAGTGRGRNRNRLGNNRNTQNLARYFPTPEKREEDALRNLIAKRRELDQEIEMRRRDLEERQLLTGDLIDELKTATGSAIDIPIDAFAGQVDASPNGGNSTTAPNAILTKQQAVDLKKAVQGAIAAALSVLSSAQNVSVDALGFQVENKLTPEQIDAANVAAAKALEDGLTTSINQGNAGVGEPNTAVVNQLLGPVSDVRTLTLTTSAFGAAATQTVAGAAGAGGAGETITASPVSTAGSPIRTSAGRVNNKGNRVAAGSNAIEKRMKLSRRAS